MNELQRQNKALKRSADVTDTTASSAHTTMLLGSRVGNTADSSVLPVDTTTSDNTGLTGLSFQDNSAEQSGHPADSTLSGAPRPDSSAALAHGLHTEDMDSTVTQDSGEIASK